LDAQESPNVELSSSPPTSLLNIKITTSRPEPAAGEGLGIIAQVANISTHVIYIREDYLTLALPPELQGFRGDYSYYAFFPTETHGQEPKRPSQPFTIALQSGEVYPVIWRFSGWSTLEELASFLFFSPGDYRVTVTAKYWVDKAPTVLANDSYRVTSQDYVLHVLAPQSVILAGAALGGMLAFILLPGVRSRSLSADQVIGGPLKRAIAAAAGISIAMALGVTVTILLSRMSRSESLIRVDASDLWSAIVVGFAANYVGLRIFQSILPTGDESRVERKENEGCA
jgi:hypothetical protein